MTELRIEPYRIPGARLEAQNPLPAFRQPDPQARSTLFDPSFPDEKKELIGWQTGARSLPYRMQDQYTRNKKPMEFKSAVLENEILRAIFLPELGGRLVSLVYKPLQRELLERNPVFQPANLALRNAWISGGVEWNTGQFGHALHTCSPVFAAKIRGPQGEPGLRLYDYERCKNHFWQIDFFLPPGFQFLLVCPRVMNPFDRPSSMYWWTNIAVPEAEDVRVLAPTDQVIFHVPCKQTEAQKKKPPLPQCIPSSLALGKLPELPILPGKDATYSTNFPYSNEFFFQCEKADMIWEAALDRNGGGFIETSTRPLLYRKLFCWGRGTGGKRWQEFLSVRGHAYIEIQAGLAPTQTHGLAMPPRGEFEWLETMGYIESDPKLVHNPDWPTAWQAVDRDIKKMLPMGVLNEKHAACRALRNQPPEEILHTASGWGALEMRRRKTDSKAPPVPEAFVFPEATMGAEQERWIQLMKRGFLPEQDVLAEPGEWMIQDEWREMLEASLKENGNWFALLHAGVMRMEQFDEKGARQAWEESIRRKPSVWAYRNLAVLSIRQKKTAEVLRNFEQAWTLAVGSEIARAALVQEYLQALCDAGEYDKINAIYAGLPRELQELDRVQVILAVIALKRGDLDTVEKILQREFTVIREGEILLTELWFGMWEKRLAEQAGREVDDDLKAEARRAHPPPARIDFRMK